MWRWRTRKAVELVFRTGAIRRTRTTRQFQSIPALPKPRNKNLPIVLFSPRAGLLPDPIGPGARAWATSLALVLLCRSRRLLSSSWRGLHHLQPSKLRRRKLGQAGLRGRQSRVAAVWRKSMRTAIPTGRAGAPGLTRLRCQTGEPRRFASKTGPHRNKSLVSPARRAFRTFFRIGLSGTLLPAQYLPASKDISLNRHTVPLRCNIRWRQPNQQRPGHLRQCFRTPKLGSRALCRCPAVWCLKQHRRPRTSGHREARRFWVQDPPLGLILEAQLQ
jgi:hypothetical protein